MAKTSQPLTLLVHPSLVGLPELVELAAKGHIVSHYEGEHLTDIWAYDLILGPSCWRMMPELLKYLPLALKGARSKKRAAKATTKMLPTSVG